MYYLYILKQNDMETLTEQQKKVILYAYIDLIGMRTAMLNDEWYDEEGVNNTIKELEENFDFIQKDKEENQ